MLAPATIIPDWQCPKCGNKAVKVYQPEVRKSQLIVVCPVCQKEYRCSIGVQLIPDSERATSPIVVATH